MADFSLIIGGAGTGKTTRLLDIMAKMIGRIDPFGIGFVSFTRAARSEAANRAGDLLGIAPSALEQTGWFRTLHSICFRQLELSRDQILSDDAESRQWLKEHIGASGGVPLFGEDVTGGDLLADDALRAWEYARVTLTPLPSEYAGVIEDYERQKNLDGKLDFTDTLGQFAGWRFSPAGHEQTTPRGAVPDVPVWFCDEQQDSNPLLDAVLRRLVADARWVYLVGDPFQSIYGFNGADPHLIDAWPVPASRRDVLHQTYRCPEPVQALGEEILRGCSDYWDRKINPAKHDGEISEINFGESWPEEVDPLQSWLMVARTRRVARRIAGRLDDAGLPWSPTKGNGGWNAPVRMAAINALRTLHRGSVITETEWAAVLKNIPAKGLLERGTKSAWSGRSGSSLTDLAHLSEWGATDDLTDRIRDGRWTSLIDNAAEVSSAIDLWGWDAIANPRIKVGTVHSVKGAEADNVLVLTSTSSIVESSYDTESGTNEEHRIAYVAATRARKRLVIASEYNVRFRMPM